MTTDDTQRAGRLRQEVRDLPTRDVETHRRASRRSFLTGGLASLAAVGGWTWLVGQQDGPGVPEPLRRGYEFGEALWRPVVDDDRLARTYTLADVEPLRINSLIGMEPPLDEASYEVVVSTQDGEELDRLDMDQIRALGDETDWIVEHKCIEGWSTIVQWGGVRFSALLDRYADAVPGWTHVGLSTPNEAYYAGLDRATMLHPQTLLAWELNGQPLTEDHGAPVRMATPLTYGISQVKRLGNVVLATDPPPDYWAERGYPYFAGL